MHHVTIHLLLVIIMCYMLQHYRSVYVSTKGSVGCDVRVMSPVGSISKSGLIGTIVLDTNGPSKELFSSSSFYPEYCAVLRPEELYCCLLQQYLGLLRTEESDSCLLQQSPRLPSRFLGIDIHLSISTT